MTSIMVSYSRKDSVVARKLIESFEKIGLDVWVDWEDIPPAVGWLNQILEGIEESDAFIFLISPDSIISEICNEEIAHAGKNNKRIIPIVVRDVDAKTVNPIIRELNWIFAREQDNFEECLAKIKLAIELDIQWVEEHRRLQVRALEWDRKKDVSLLLRGRDLRSASNMVISAASKDPKPTDLQHIYIHHSQRDERFRTAMWVAIAFAVVLLGIISFIAYNQYRLASRQLVLESANAKLTSEKLVLEQQKSTIAQENERIAKENEQLAKESENTAKGQRSVARAQIYLTRPGELYISTLFAIDAWDRIKSSEAMEILRNNISLLPIPVDQMNQQGQINSVEFSPDGESFVTTSADKTACVWNVKDKKKLFCADSPGPVNDAAFSPNGEVLVTGDQTGKVFVLNAKTGEVQKEFNFGVTVWNVNISHDSESLAVTRDDGIIKIINLSGRKADYELRTVGRPLVSAFSPDGNWFATGSNLGGITIWNLNVRGAAITGPFHKGEVLALEFSPDSGVLLSGGTDDKAFVTQTKTGKLLFDVIEQGRVEDLTFSPKGSWFVTVSDDRSVRVWDTETEEERTVMSQDGPVKEVQVSPDGRWIASTGEDRTVRVWSSATGTEMLQIPLKSGGSALSFSKDGKFLVSGTQNGEINVWDLSSMTAPVNEIPFRGSTGNVKFTPSGDRLALSDESRVWLLNKDQYSTLKSSPQGELILDLSSDIIDLAISPDSKWITVSTEDGDLAIYNLGSKIKRIISQSSSPQKLSISPDSKQLITGSVDGTIQTRELSSGKVIKTLFEAKSRILSLETSSELLAIGLKDKVVILNLNTGEVLDEINSPGDHEVMAFNPQGSLLALNSSSGDISIWKQENGEFTLHQSFPRGPAFSMDFNPQGDELLLGESNLVYLINALSGEEIIRIPQKIPANSLSFSPDGNLIAVASLKVVQIWDLAKIPQIGADHLVEAACGRMFENFDKAQWDTFFKGEDYKPLCPDLPVPK